jgi:hypothetical protein
MASTIAECPLDYTKGPEPMPEHLLDDAEKAADQRIRSCGKDPFPNR